MKVGEDVEIFFKISKFMKVGEEDVEVQEETVFKQCKEKKRRFKQNAHVIRTWILNMGLFPFYSVGE